MYVQFAFYFILTIIFVITGIMLNGAFKRQMGHPDVVRHFFTRMRTPVHFNVGHLSDAEMGHALAHLPCIVYPDCNHPRWYEQACHVQLYLLDRVIELDREQGILVLGALWLDKDCC